MARGDSNPLAGVNEAKAISFLKKNGSADKAMSETVFAEGAGVPRPKAGIVLWALEPKAFPELVIKPTNAAITKARRDGLRWERIAARTGKSVADVKKAFEEHTGESADSSRAKRGPKTDGPAKSTRASGKSETGTSGRRAARQGAKGNQPNKQAPQRARTRAERQARRSDPS